MNFDLVTTIIKLVFAIIDDTEIRDNKTFQLARGIVSAVGEGAEQPAANSQPPGENRQ